MPHGLEVVLVFVLGVLILILAVRVLSGVGICICVHHPGVGVRVGAEVASTMSILPPVELALESNRARISARMQTKITRSATPKLR